MCVPYKAHALCCAVHDQVFPCGKWVDGFMCDKHAGFASLKYSRFKNSN